MSFDVPKVVRSPGCDHGHDEESRNGRDVKIHILDDMVRPRGQAHEAVGRCKKEFCGGQGAKRRRPWRLALGQTPRPMASGPDAKDCGVWSWSLSGTLAFQAKPILRRLLLQVSTPGLNI